MQTAAELAQAALQDDVEKVGATRLNNCLLTTWRTAKSLPVTRIVICDNGSEEYVASSDLPSFARLLKDVRPESENLEECLKLLKAAFPSHLWLLPDPDSKYINTDTGDRPPPVFGGSAFVFYCNDSQSGRVLRVSWNNEYDLSVDDVGEGVKMDLL